MTIERNSELSFLIAPMGDYPNVLSLTPVVNGTLLTKLVADFERESGFEPAGGYGGLVPDWFAYGSLQNYFEGKADGDLSAEGFYLLGCECGEVGCWPLLGQIECRGSHMVWHSFQQAHRKDRDYSRFGPFVFDLSSYRAAVNEAASHFER